MNGDNDSPAMLLLDSPAPDTAAEFPTDFSAARTSSAGFGDCHQESVHEHDTPVIDLNNDVLHHAVSGIAHDDGAPSESDATFGSLEYCYGVVDCGDEPVFGDSWTVPQNTSSISLPCSPVCSDNEREREPTNRRASVNDDVQGRRNVLDATSTKKEPHEQEQEECNSQKDEALHKASYLTARILNGVTESSSSQLRGAESRGVSLLPSLPLRAIKCECNAGQLIAVSIPRVRYRVHVH